MIDLGCEYKILQKSGSWYSYGEETIGQGREAAKAWLREHEDDRATIKEAIREELGMSAKELPAEEEDDESVAANGVAS